MIYLQLFLSFLQIGLLSIGGGYAAIPFIQAQVVQKHACDLVTIAEMTPGPIAVNSATFVGIRIAGISGALVATFGCILPSLFIVSLLAYIYYRYKSIALLQDILTSLRPAVVALIASAGILILMQVIFPEAIYSLPNINVVGTLLFLVAFLLLRVKWNPILVMVLCGVVNLLISLVIK